MNLPWALHIRKVVKHSFTFAFFFSCEEKSKYRSWNSIQISQQPSLDIVKNIRIHFFIRKKNVSGVREGLDPRVSLLNSCRQRRKNRLWKWKGFWKSIKSLSRLAIIHLSTFGSDLTGGYNHIKRGHRPKEKIGSVPHRVANDRSQNGETTAIASHSIIIIFETGWGGITVISIGRRNRRNEFKF